MRPTTKDLAEAAGVSLATVDRVLNDRPNVSKKAQEKVREAIESIGFVRNQAAVNLVRNKTYRYIFLFPTKGDLYLEILANQVRETSKRFKADMINAEVVQLNMEDPHIAANYLSTLTLDDTDGVAVMAPESPQVRDAMKRLQERGLNSLQLLSGQENLSNIDFVGTDNFAAGSTAARLIGKFLNHTKGEIMVIAETMQSLDSIERRFGFDKVINSSFPDLIALPTLETHSDEERAEQIISKQLAHHKNIIAIYVISPEARIPLEKTSKSIDLTQLIVVAHERTKYTEDAIKNNMVDAIIAQNPGHTIRSAIRILHAKSEKREILTDQEKIRLEIFLQDNL